MQTNDASTDVDVECGDDEPTRRFTGPGIDDSGEAEAAARMVALDASWGLPCDPHATPVGGVPALVRMTASDDVSSQPRGTLIRFRRAAVASTPTATFGVGIRFGRAPRPKSAESELAARMSRIGAALVVRLRDEEERSASAQAWRSVLIGVVLALSIAWAVGRLVP